MTACLFSITENALRSTAIITYVMKKKIIISGFRGNIVNNFYIFVVSNASSATPSSLHTSIKIFLNSPFES